LTTGQPNWIGETFRTDARRSFAVNPCGVKKSNSTMIALSSIAHGVDYFVFPYDPIKKVRKTFLDLASGYRVFAIATASQAPFLIDRAYVVTVTVD
jgi:hypothetical protein